MKLKKVAALCSSANAFCLFDRVDGDGVVTQWLGDGCCAFPLHGLPVLSEPELYRMFDVSEKKQDKIYFNHSALPCGAVWMVFPVSTKASFDCGTNVTIAGRISRYAWERRTAPCGAGTTKLFCAWAKRWTRCPWRRSFWSVLHARVHIKRRKNRELAGAAFSPDFW